MHPLRSILHLPDPSSKTAYTAYPSLHGSSQRSHLHGTSHPPSAACQLRSTSTHLSCFGCFLSHLPTSRHHRSSRQSSQHLHHHSDSILHTLLYLYSCQRISSLCCSPTPYPDASPAGATPVRQMHRSGHFRLHPQRFADTYCPASLSALHDAESTQDRKWSPLLKHHCFSPGSRSHPIHP